MRPTDRDLLRSCATDAAAFEALYRRHVDAVTRFTARRVAKPADLADVVAEVFVVAIESAHRFDGAHDTALPWLYGIARNKLAELHRRDRRRRDAAERAAVRDLTDDEFALLLDRIDAQRAAPALIRALDRLPDRDRALLEMVALDGLPVGDAARRLGMASPAARMRLTRLRRRTRHLMDGEAADVAPASPAPGREETT